MIIYTDNIVGGKAGQEMSPAISYLMIKDFAQILDEISNGNIPTGTGQPFDVNYGLEEPNKDTPPWFRNTPTDMNYSYNQQNTPSYINPWGNL